MHVVCVCEYIRACLPTYVCTCVCVFLCVYIYVHHAGHAGKDVAIYSSRNLHMNVVRSEAFKQKNYEKALKVCKVLLLCYSHTDVK